MTQAYSDPEREDDLYSLPDLEVWEDGIAEVHCDCGVYDVPESHIDGEETYCPSCDRAGARAILTPGRSGWFYWFCLPGCLPDSEVNGPFDTEEEALAEAREGMDYE